MGHSRSQLWQRPPRACLRLVCCVAAAAALAGCTSGISVRQAKVSPLLAAWHASAVDADDLSPRTLQTLRRLDLANLYHRQPVEVFARLHVLAVDDPQPDIVFALAEISFRIGRDAERFDNCEAIAYYYLCAGYAYHYLFDNNVLRPIPADAGGCPECRAAEEAFDPRFRLACDLYNNGLAKCIRAAQRIGRLDPKQQLHLPTADGQKFTLSVDHHGFAWRPEEFGPLLFCSDYQVVGMQNNYRGYGLGVPLIGTRVAAANAAPGHAFYPREMSFPVTAFFRFEGSLADLGARRAGRLELYNPLAISKIDVQGRPVPLETDLTTPLAFFLSRTDLDGLEYAAFLRPERLHDRAGIYLFEPYQPGKIPVLMIHGLLSSPVTWTPLLNDLRADPVLNERYQFWFYRYPTGNPYLATAADLRQALARLRNDIDPQHRDPALDQMIVVGHSMGGLVGKLLTQESGEDFWHLFSKQPFDTLKAGTDARQELRQVFYFERESAVRRVIFLGTPHHGSKLSPSPPARLLAKFIRLPKKLMSAATDVMKENPDFWNGPEGKAGATQVPTSLDLLTPGTPALELLAARPAPAGVQYHSVIGELFGDGKESSDGVVPYSSAHIDGVASELLIPAHHSEVHHHPRAVLEVRRILYEHVQTLAGH